MSRLILAVLVALPLVACGSGSDEVPVEAPATAEPRMLGGVDLGQPVRALGTEPFWGMAISPDTLVYTGIDEAQPVTAANPGPEVQGTTAVYASATADGTAMVVTLVAGECSDGMSDRVYPLTARVELGELSLNGCAQSAAVLDAEPRP